ncbi:hypothetical protein NHQ30_009852 [Ciborinia camelliae]|nr:hypothetical protein NHQ30_009852 [Ciborinia camelliae]
MTDPKSLSNKNQECINSSAAQLYLEQARLDLERTNQKRRPKKHRNVEGFQKIHRKRFKKEKLEKAKLQKQLLEHERFEKEFAKEIERELEKELDKKQVPRKLGNKSQKKLELGKRKWELDDRKHAFEEEIEEIWEQIEWELDEIKLELDIEKQTDKRYKEKSSKVQEKSEYSSRKRKLDQQAERFQSNSHEPDPKRPNTNTDTSLTPDSETAAFLGPIPSLKDLLEQLKTAVVNMSALEVMKVRLWIGVHLDVGIMTRLIVRHDDIEPFWINKYETSGMNVTLKRIVDKSSINDLLKIRSYIDQGLSGVVVYALGDSSVLSEPNSSST